MLKDNTLNGIQEVIFPLCQPHFTNLKRLVTDQLDFSPLLLHMLTYFREVFVTSQGIPKLRNISTNFSEVFVISQGIPKLRNISTHFKEAFVISQGIPKLLPEYLNLL